MEEIWKGFIFGGMDYKISNKGRVFGMGSGKVLKVRLDCDGYEIITCGDASFRTGLRIHRLVATHFVNNPNNLSEVNHIDFDRTNNNFTNLEWISHLDNVKYTVNANRHAGANGNYKGKNNPNYGNTKLSNKYKANPKLALENQSRPGSKNGRAKPVIMYNSDMHKVEIFSYIGQCAEYMREKEITKAKTNTIRSNISQSVKSNKKYLGYYFEFKHSN